jgi:hypothetical protein
LPAIGHITVHSVAERILDSGNTKVSLLDLRSHVFEFSANSCELRVSAKEPTELPPKDIGLIAGGVCDWRPLA